MEPEGEGRLWPEHRQLPDKVFLRSRDVALILDVSPDEVLDLVRKKKLKAVKIGKYWSYRPADVFAFKERQARSK